VQQQVNSTADLSEKDFVREEGDGLSWIRDFEKNTCGIIIVSRPNI